MSGAAPGFVAGSGDTVLLLVLGDQAMRVVRARPEAVVVDAPSATGPGARRAGPASLVCGDTRVDGLNARWRGTADGGEEYGLDLGGFAQARALGALFGVCIERRALLAPPWAEPIVETFEQADVIRQKLEALARGRETIFVRGSQEQYESHVIEGGDPAAVEIEAPPGIRGGNARVEVHGPFMVHSFELRGLRRTDRGLRGPLPTEWDQWRVRSLRRAPAPRGARLVFRHPSFPTHSVIGVLHDVSPRGLAFSADWRDHALYPGLVVSDAVIEGLDALPMRVSGIVRVAPERPGLVGFSLDLEAMAPAERRRWQDRAGDVLTPSTRVGATWSEDSWDLFERSGYFRIAGKVEADFAPLKRHFATVARRLDAAPWLGCQVVRTSSRGIEGSISLVLLYRHALFGFQIARRRDDGEPGAPRKHQVLREMSFRAYEHAMLYNEARWLIGFVQDKVQWSRLLHYEFPQRYAEQGLSGSVDFHVYEIELGGHARPRATAGWTTGPLRPDEQPLFLSWLGAHRPRCYTDALDLVPERLQMEGLSRLWKDAGLQRERHLVGVRKQDRLCAVGVLETAEPGLHLFGLLDAARFYPLTDDGTLAFPALLTAARSWYADRGRNRFVLLHESRPFAGLESARDLGEAHLTMMSTSLLPNLLEFIYETTAFDGTSR